MPEKRTAVVTLTDSAYFYKAKRTILDVRSRGKWMGDIVLITVGFKCNQNFLDFYNVTQYYVEHINTNKLLEEYKKCPIGETCDNRQYVKLTQWDKFYVFSNYFKQWDRVIFLDAGLRVLDEIQNLVDVPCDGVILALRANSDVNLI